MLRETGQWSVTAGGVNATATAKVPGIKGQTHHLLAITAGYSLPITGIGTCTLTDSVAGILGTWTINQTTLGFLPLWVGYDHPIRFTQGADVTCTLSGSGNGLWTLDLNLWPAETANWESLSSFAVTGTVNLEGYTSIDAIYPFNWNWLGVGWDRDKINWDDLQELNNPAGPSGYQYPFNWEFAVQNWTGVVTSQNWEDLRDKTIYVAPAYPYNWNVTADSWSTTNKTRWENYQ
jgi:hypothetical protein